VAAVLFWSVVDLNSNHFYLSLSTTHISKMPQTAPYGTWNSPITAESIVSNSISFDDVIVDPLTSIIYHTEKRPSEEGRVALVKTESGADLAGKDFNCRTGVEEYGGAASAAYGGTIYFSNFTTGQAYQLKDGGQPEAITPESSVHRFADFAVFPNNERFIVAILEDHTKPDPPDVVTTLCVIDSETKVVSTFLSGADFYAAPTFSPDGTHIAWQQWSFPDMPWDGGCIYVAKVAVDEKAGTLTVSDEVHVGGKYKEIGAAGPKWVTNDLLIFTCDQSGFQNPWKYTVSAKKSAPILKDAVAEDFSLPGWLLGGSYGAITDTSGKRGLFTSMRDGRSRLYVLGIDTGSLEEIDCPYVSITNMRRVTEDNVVFIALKSDEPAAIVLCSLKDYAKPQFTVLKSSAGSDTPPLPNGLISKPEPITIAVPPNGEPLYVVFYPPTNPDYVGPEGENPPCVVNVHGGPTGQATQDLSMTTQYFTSRGWAWLDINYGGSSGYGRIYVDRLNGNWGIVDVRDCYLTVGALSNKPYSLIDPTRTAIRGGSAGGFTVLATLCAYPDAFAAGTSLYGISDLKKLGEFTHKFESHYLEGLIGGTYEQIPEVYKERSPVYNADKIKAPLLIEQGSLDAVVPPEQAEDIVKQIKANGGRVDYVLFEGEGHGWRKAETIKAALEKELGFYEDVFKLK